MVQASSPTVLEVGEHPDHRQIATFFLGWAFFISLQCIASGVFHCLHRSVSGAPFPSDHEKASTYDATSTLTIHNIRPSLMFSLSICFMFASIASFASLLSFSSGGDTVCAFVMAWGGLSAQFGRLAALSIILVALRRLGIGKRETVAFIGWLVAGLCLVFANFAVGTGSISKLDKDIFLCHREHNLGFSLGASFVYSLIEVYAIGRILSLTYSQSRDAIAWLVDQRVCQALSLLTLELLTVVPSALFTGILGDFIPFSIGAVIVLLTFSRPCESTKDPPVVQGVQGQGPSDAAVLRDLYLASNHHHPSVPSRSISRPRRSTRQSAPYSQPLALSDHPYGAKSLEQSAFEQDKWTGYRTARSSRTVDSRSLRSVGEAVVEVVRRSRNPWARPLSNGANTPPLPAFESALSLVRPRLVMMESTHKHANEDVKRDSSHRISLVIPDPILDSVQSRFSVSSDSLSAQESSVPSSPLATVRRPISDFTRVVSSANAPNPSNKSTVISLSNNTMSSSTSSHHSMASDADLSSESAQIVTIMVPPLLTHSPSDHRPTQFRAAGYANPIPLPKFPRDVAGRAVRAAKADEPHPVGSHM